MSKKRQTRLVVIGQAGKAEDILIFVNNASRRRLVKEYRDFFQIPATNRSVKIIFTEEVLDDRQTEMFKATNVLTNSRIFGFLETAVKAGAKIATTKK